MMDFPEYVPPAVRTYITKEIEGDKWNKRGRAAVLADVELRLTKIIQTLEKQTLRGEVKSLGSLCKERDETVKSRDRLKNDVECLQRLANDENMRVAFQLLTDEFYNDDQCREFIHSAWTALIDYTPYRDQLKCAVKLNNEIADTAANLAMLINKFLKTSVETPDEFYSVRKLLLKTENKELHEHDVNMWRVMRDSVLGELPLRDISESELEQSQGDCDTGSALEIDQEEKMRKSIRYGWENAPSLSALLETVAKAAREFKPNEYGMIGAAIDNRQKNPKNEYLRAFVSLLIDEYQLTLTPNVMKVMVIVSNVVIHSPDDIVVYKDVQNVNEALIKRRGDHMAIGDVKDGEPIKIEDDTSYERLMEIMRNMEMKKRAKRNILPE